MLNAVVDRRVAAHPVDQLVALVDQPVVQVDLEVVILVTVEAQLILAVATPQAQVDQALATVEARLHLAVATPQVLVDQALATAGARLHLAVATPQVRVDQALATAGARLHQQAILQARVDQALATVADPQLPAVRADQALVPVDQEVALAGLDQAAEDLIMMIIVGAKEVKLTLAQLQSLLMGQDMEDKG